MRGYKRPLAVIAAGLLVASCGNGMEPEPVADDNGNGSEATRDLPTPTDDDSIEASAALSRDFGADGNKVAQAYLDYREYAYQMLTTRHLDDDEAQQFVIGAEYDELVNQFDEIEMGGEYVGQDSYSVLDVSIDDNQAQLLDCRLYAAEIVHDGEDVPDQPGDGERRTQVVELQNQDAGWVVTSIETPDVDSDRLGCVPVEIQDDLTDFLAGTYQPALQQAAYELDAAPLEEYTNDEVFSSWQGQFAGLADQGVEFEDAGDPDYQAHVSDFGVVQDFDSYLAIEWCSLQHGEGLVEQDGDTVGTLQSNGRLEAAYFELERDDDGTFSVAAHTYYAEDDPENDEICEPLQ